MGDWLINGIIPGDEESEDESNLSEVRRRDIILRSKNNWTHLIIVNIECPNLTTGIYGKRDYLLDEVGWLVGLGNCIYTISSLDLVYWILAYFSLV